MRNGINKKERQASAASGPIVLDSRRCPFTLSVFFFLSFFVFFSFAPRHQHDISASFFLLSRRPLLLLLCHVLFIRIGATRLPLARTSRSHFYFSGRFLLIFAVYAISRATVLLSLFTHNDTEVRAYAQFGLVEKKTFRRENSVKLGKNQREAHLTRGRNGVVTAIWWQYSVNTTERLKWFSWE